MCKNICSPVLLLHLDITKYKTAIELTMFLINMSHLFTLPVNTEMPHYRAINIEFRVICLILKFSTQNLKVDNKQQEREAKKKKKE